MKKTALLIAALLMIPFLSGISEAANSLYLNNSKIAGRVLVIDGSSYISAESLAEKLRTHVAFFPSSGTVVFNGRHIKDFIKANGVIYISAKEASAAVGGMIKFNSQTRDLYISANPSKASAVSSSNTPIPSAGYSIPSPPSSMVTETSQQPLYGSIGSSSRPSSRFSSIRPSHSDGILRDGLRMPRNATISGVPAPPESPSFKRIHEIQQRGNFSPKSGKNAVFSVTVNDMEEIGSMKNGVSASAGKKYIVLYISQQNISKDPQIYTGKFTLMDEHSRVYDYLEGLSNYWLAILKPGGSNYGYIVFEVPADEHPVYLVLNAMNQPPLSIDLIH